jgi:flagellar biosynthetic protein FliR
MADKYGGGVRDSALRVRSNVYLSMENSPWPPILVTGVLVFFRVGGLLLIAPLLSSRSVPSPMRAGFAVLLTVILTPVVPGVPDGVALGPLALATELLAGFGLGLGAAVLISAAEMTGDILATQTGLSGGTVLNPVSGQGTSVLAQLLGLFSLLLLLVTGGHLVLIESLATSFTALPPGSGGQLDQGLRFLLETMGLLFVRGMIFASPVVASVLVGYVALGVLAKTSPQLNMLAVAFPLQIGLGLLMLAFALPLIATFYSAWPSHVRDLATGYMTALGGG